MRAIILSMFVFAVLGQTADRRENPEAAAISTLRAINRGQASYSSMCTKYAYAVDLADLAKPPFGDHRAFVDPELYANGVMIAGVYVVTIEKDAAPNVVTVGSAEETCNGSEHPPVSAYYASATPIVPGLRYFATDTRGTVFVSTRLIQNPIRTGVPLR